MKHKETYSQAAYTHCVIRVIPQPRSYSPSQKNGSIYSIRHIETFYDNRPIPSYVAQDLLAAVRREALAAVLLWSWTLTMGIDCWECDSDLCKALPNRGWIAYSQWLQFRLENAVRCIYCNGFNGTPIRVTVIECDPHTVEFTWMFKRHATQFVPKVGHMAFSPFGLLR